MKKTPASTAQTEPLAGKSTAANYHLKVVLSGTEPPIWRCLQVPANARLDWLHAVIQVAMGWTNSHLHQFRTETADYSANTKSLFDDGGESRTLDAKRFTLAQLASHEGEVFCYEYDFGDTWEHLLTVEKILPAAPATATAALCLDGARACPPEDCGGPWGYEDLLTALNNPKHPEHENMVEWLGRPFDAAAFEVAKTNKWLAKLKWPRVTEAQLRTVLMARDGYRK